MPRSSVLVGRLARLTGRQVEEDDSGSESGVGDNVNTPNASVSPQDPERVNEQFGGVNPSIRTLTAIPPSQVTPTSVLQGQSSTLQTVVSPPVSTSTLQNINQNTPVAFSSIVASIGSSSAPVAVPQQTAETEVEGTLASGAEYDMEEVVADVKGSESQELGNQENEAALPENNRGIAIGIAFGVFALLAVLMVGAFLFMRWRKKKSDSIFDRPPPPGIDRSNPLVGAAPDPTYMNEKMPDQQQYATYANLEGDNSGTRQSLNRWIQNTASRFSTPTTEGFNSTYDRQNDAVPPPPPSFLQPGRNGGGGI